MFVFEIRNFPPNRLHVQRSKFCGDEIQIPANRNVCVLDKIRRWEERRPKARYKNWVHKLGIIHPEPAFPGPGCVSHYPAAETFSTDIQIYIQVSRV